MSKAKLLFAGTACGWCLLSYVIAAQTSQAEVPLPVSLPTETDPSEHAPFRFGTLAVAPAVISVVGHDSNVYREVTGFADYEVFAVPQVAVWWTQPGFRVTAASVFEMISFANNVGGRNATAAVKIERLHSLSRPFFSYSRSRTNANVTGFEVGYKSLRLLNDFLVGERIDLSPRMGINAAARLMRTGWDADARYQTSSLREKLNRDTLATEVSVSYAVTPLTSMRSGIASSRDRFKFSPIRNGDSQQLFTAIEFEQAAFLHGRAQVGFEHFSTPAAGAADFNGLTADSNIGWRSPDGTAIIVTVNRETSYSFDNSLAYFVATGANITGGRPLGESWEAVGFLGRYDLDYGFAGTSAGTGRVDRVTEWGGALAYHLRPWMRMGWSMQRLVKTGPGAFSAFQLAAFWTYGHGKLQQISCLPATEFEGVGRACR